MLILLWVIGLVLGFGFMQLALKLGSFTEALYFSGTTFVTVTYGDLVPRTGAMKAVSIIEGGCGLGFLALVIGYLPVLYQLFASREAHVILLDERAGSPPTAATLLKKHAEDLSLDSLDQLLREWELWASELMESHTSYPMLSYYRSQYSNQSWLGAMALIMDTCSVLMVGIHGMRTFQARMTFSVARLAIVELSRVLSITEFEQPKPKLTSSQFIRMRETLKESGLNLIEADAELQLAKYRATYEPFLASLAKDLMVSLPGWVSSEEETARQ